MGNICSLFSKNNENSENNLDKNIQIATPLYECTIDCSGQFAQGIPIASPLSVDYLNNQQQFYNRNNNQTIFINNTQPYYYNNGVAAMDGFFTGMLVGELMDNDCNF